MMSVIETHPPFEVILKSNTSPSPSPVLPPEILVKIWEQQSLDTKDFSTVSISNKLLRDTVLPFLYNKVVINNPDILYRFMKHVSPLNYSHMKFLTINCDQQGTRYMAHEFEEAAKEFRSRTYTGEEKVLMKVSGLPRSIPLDLFCKGSAINKVRVDVRKIVTISQRNGLSSIPCPLELLLPLTPTVAFSRGGSGFGLKKVVATIINHLRYFKQPATLLMELVHHVLEEESQELKLWGRVNEEVIAQMYFNVDFLDPLDELFKNTKTFEFKITNQSMGVHTFCGDIGDKTIHPRVKLQRCKGVCLFTGPRTPSQHLVEQFFRVKDFRFTADYWEGLRKDFAKALKQEKEDGNSSLEKEDDTE